MCGGIGTVKKKEVIKEGMFRTYTRIF